ncbi:MAG: hypothetical protein CL760_00845 [Chloroflexi bacterium]|nr:hypothetical protein [Chloroflexota bacterium]
MKELFNLPELQKYMYHNYGFRVRHSMELADSLYEMGAITDPRTSQSNYPLAFVDKYLELLNAVKTNIENEEDLSFLNKGKALDMVISGKSDEHAILPTKKLFNINDLKHDEKMMYIAIAKNFLEY